MQEAVKQGSIAPARQGVTFSFELVPSDMKFLAFINGELNDAATYFSSFANVSKEGCIKLDGKFGTTPDCNWRPWLYQQRLNFAKQVAKFKNKLPSTLAKSTQRTKVTQFIANKKSRQEFEPLIGEQCDK